MATALQRFRERAKIGARMELIGYEVNGAPASHKYMHVERVVRIAGSRQFGLAVGDGAPSYCDWPKASELAWLDDNTARIQSCVTLTYRFL